MSSQYIQFYVLNANMKLKQLFIQNLKAYRKNRGISQMKLAELCNTSTSYIGQIEIGNRFPSLEMIEKIANALQIKPHLLFFSDSDEPIDKKIAHIKSDKLSRNAKSELTKALTDAIRRIVNKKA